LREEGERGEEKREKWKSEEKRENLRVWSSEAEIILEESNWTLLTGAVCWWNVFVHSPLSMFHIFIQNINRLSYFIFFFRIIHINKSFVPSFAHLQHQ